MKQVDLKELERLLSSGDKEKVTNLLREYFASEMTDEEKGMVYINLASIYLKVMNEFNSRYKEVLDKAINTLKYFDTKGQEIDDQGALAEARAKIKGV